MKTRNWILYVLSVRLCFIMLMRQMKVLDHGSRKNSQTSCSVFLPMLATIAENENARFLYNEELADQLLACSSNDGLSRKRVNFLFFQFVFSRRRENLLLRLRKIEVADTGISAGQHP
jgi:hypothetical protein